MTIKRPKCCFLVVKVCKVECEGRSWKEEWNHSEDTIPMKSSHPLKGVSNVDFTYIQAKIRDVRSVVFKMV